MWPPTAYPSTNGSADRLAEVWSLTARETWTACELGGMANAHTVAVVCAFRADDAPAKAPLPVSKSSVACSDLY